MAKKRKKASAPRRRRRMSGISSGSVMNSVQTAAGLVLGSVTSTVLQRMAGGKLSPKLMAAGQMVAGFWLDGHAKSPLIKGVAMGVISAGAISFTHDIGLINGIEDLVSGYDDEDGQGYIGQEYEMNGMDNRRYIAGLSNLDTVGDVGVGRMNISGLAVGM